MHNTSSWPSVQRIFAALFLVVAALLLSGVAPASADLNFCPPGSGAGQCDSAQGVAVDTETGRVYVADRKNNRVNVFETDGSFQFAFGWGVADGTTNALQKCTATCFKGIAGSGAGQLSRPTQIAVDNIPGSASRHDVYVVDTENRYVQKFNPEGSYLFSIGTPGKGECQLSKENDPIAIGPGGTLYVADSARIGVTEAEGYIGRIEKFDPTAPSGVCLGEAKLFEEVGVHRVTSLAVDSGENTYVTVEGANVGLRKYDPSGTLLYELDKGTETRALAVDNADNVFAAQKGSDARFITKYDSAGNHLRRWGYGQIQSSAWGLAAYHPAADDVFYSEEFNEGGGLVRYSEPPPRGPIIRPESVKAAPIGNAKATLKAEVNPEGKATTYRFDYLSQKAFEAQGGFTGPATKSVEGTLSGSDFELHTAEAIAGCPNPLTEAAEDKCLEPQTAYRFRILAEDSEGKEDEVEATFTTRPPLELLATYAAEVGTDTASLRAQVNPLGVPASGYFEYVDDASFQASGFAEALRIPDVPSESEIEFGSGEAPTTRAVSLSPLAPGTTYHYRAIVANPLTEPIVGPAKAFTTFKQPPPPSPCPANEAFRSGPSALLPDCRAYEMVSPLDKNNGDIIALGEATTRLPATLDQSSTSGSKLAYGSYRAFGDAESGAYTSQYVAARGQSGWSSHGISPPRMTLTLEAAAILDTEFKAFSGDLCQAWFRSVAEPSLSPDAVAGFSNIYRRQDQAKGCAGKGYAAVTTVEPPTVKPYEYFPLELQGLSADGNAAIYVANDRLTEDAPKLGEVVGKRFQLYEQVGGETRFVCILPDGKASKTPCQAGGPGIGLSRTANLENAISADGSRVFWTAYTGFPSPGQIYVRINGEETVAVSKKAEELSGTSASQYWTAAADGSKAIFTTGQDLYEFDVEAKTTTLIAHKSAGILDAGEDASYVYFASEEALGGPNAEGDSPVAGQPNLYLAHEGTVRFVMTLAQGDVAIPQGGRTPPISLEPISRASRVTPDGLHAAFMTAASLSGYDNADAASGKADAEVYLYDASAEEGAGRLVCASCNPTGARPAGIDRSGGDYWVAAQIPTWENTLYAARVLADDGSRLFFESTDTLVPRDTNGVKDVYQWEQAGAGDCTTQSPTFSPSNGGCIDLISSGKSPQASEFVDASPSGKDVFIRTLSSLVAPDYGLIDIYDARIDGGLPTPPPAAPECEGDACQNPSAPPNDPTPSSASFKGAGDPKVNGATNPRCGKGKRKVRKAGKTRCVKSGKRRHKRADAGRRAGR